MQEWKKLYHLMENHFCYVMYIGLLCSLDPRLFFFFFFFIDEINIQIY